MNKRTGSLVSDLFRFQVLNEALKINKIIPGDMELVMQLELRFYLTKTALSGINPAGECMYRHN